MMENLLEAIGGFNRLMIIFGGAVAALFVCWVGFNWMMAQGDPQKLASARSGLIGVVVGLVIMGISFIVPGIVSEGVVEPAGGQALVEQQVGLSCDALLKRLVIATPTATNADRIKRLINQVQTVNEEYCGTELWTPQPLQTANPQSNCVNVQMSNDHFLRGVVLVPPELRDNVVDTIKKYTTRGANGNMVIHWSSGTLAHLPSDGAHCWVFLSSEQVWKSVS